MTEKLLKIGRGIEKLFYERFHINFSYDNFFTFHIFNPLNSRVEQSFQLKRKGKKVKTSTGAL